MAPEQATLEPTVPDSRWDVYSLGALMYALVTGTPPHEDSALLETLNHTANLPHRLKKYRDWVANTGRVRIAGSRAWIGAGRHHQPVPGGQPQRPASRRRRGGQGPGASPPLLAPQAAADLRPDRAGGGHAGDDRFRALIGEKVLERAQETLGSQLRSDEEVMARLGANVLQNKLDERVAEVERRAGDPALIADLQMGADQAKLTEELETLPQVRPAEVLFQVDAGQPPGLYRRRCHPRAPAVRPLLGLARLVQRHRAEVRRGGQVVPAGGTDLHLGSRTSPTGSMRSSTTTHSA